MQLNPNAKPILQVKNLSIRFPNRYGEIPLVDNISFTVNEGETMGLVGESGCGNPLQHSPSWACYQKQQKSLGKCFSQTVAENNTVYLMLTI